MKKAWWKEAVVYQIYWRSFFDTNGDGFGDLPGVIQKLDYIKQLGVEVIWLNPCFESPDVDNGYDISDYQSIMKKAGTMADFDTLLSETHKRGMKLIMDLVVNHTSDQHPWFLASKSSKDNPYRDFYIWAPPKENSLPPNNWRSYFNPSAWKFDEGTNEYYFHSFAVEQPDLNWENPVLREHIYSMMRFWLDKGVDGFRMDAIALLAKQPGFPDAENPTDISYLGNNSKLHAYLQEMHEQVLKHYDVLTVGELAFVSSSDAALFVGEERRELQTLFHFEVCDYMTSWDAAKFKDIQKRWYDALWGKGWNSQFLNNHDHTRLVSRFGNDQQFRVPSAKLFATMIHTLPGTPYVYQGEEIGMTGVRFPSLDDYDDIAFKNKYREEVSKGRDSQEVFAELQPLARDNSRTPMQWNRQTQAGFTTGEPWIKVNPNYTELNVEADLSSPDSIYRYYQQLIRLRKTNPVMVYGTYEPLLEDDPQVYAYVRSYEGMRWLIVLNVSDQVSQFELPAHVNHNGAKLVIGNLRRAGDEQNVNGMLMPYEACIWELPGA